MRVVCYLLKSTSVLLYMYLHWSTVVVFLVISNIWLVDFLKVHVTRFPCDFVVTFKYVLKRTF